VLALLGLAAGCGGAHDHVRAGTEIRRTEPEGALARAYARPPLAPPCRRVALTLGTSTGDAGPVAAERVLAHLAEALARTGAIDTVFVGVEDMRYAPEPAGVVVEVTPRRIALGETDGEDSTSAVVAYLFLGIWSDWFHDRRATLECAVSLTLRDARTGRIVGRVADARAATGEDLSFWERRGGFWPVLATLFWVPPMAFDTAPERVAPILLPRAADGIAAAVLDALASLKARELRTIAFAPEPSAGISVSLVELKAVTATASATGAPRAAWRIGQGVSAVGAPPETTVRLSGPLITSVRRVWIGEELAYEAPADDAAPAGTRRLEIALKPGRKLLASGGREVIQAQVGDRPPVRLGELSTRTEWRVGEP